MTLRVAHVLNSPGRGGVPRVAHALIRHLDPQDVASHVFYLKRGSGDDLFGDMDIPRHVATSDSKATAMTALVPWLEENRIDILHTHSFRPNLYARMAGAVLRPKGLRIVAHYHNDYSDKWIGDALALESSLAAITHAALAVSASVAKQVEAATSQVAQVLPNGIDLERVTGGDRRAGRAALDLPDEARVIGLVGRVCHQKGVDTFVEAAGLLCSRLPDLRAVVLGDIEDKALAETLKGRLAVLGLSERLTFAGHCSDMADIYAALDVVAAPSRWEGFGLALAEAMAAGVPVVAANVGGIPDVIGRVGCLLPPEDPVALASAIETVLSAPCAKRIAQGKAQAQKFDWAVSANKVLNIYQKLAS